MFIKLKLDGTFLIAGEYDNDNRMYSSQYNISQYYFIEGRCIYKLSEKTNADGFNIRSIVEINDYILTMSWCTKLKVWE